MASEKLSNAGVTRIYSCDEIYDEIGVGHDIKNVANTSVNKWGVEFHVENTRVVDETRHKGRGRRAAKHLVSGGVGQFGQLDNMPSREKLLVATVNTANLNVVTCPVKVNV